MDTMSWFVSGNLHYEAICNIFNAPMSFFDTTVSYFGPSGSTMLNFGHASLSVVSWVYLEKTSIVSNHVLERE